MEVLIGFLIGFYIIQLVVTFTMLVAGIYSSPIWYEDVIEAFGMKEDSKGLQVLIYQLIPFTWLVIPVISLKKVIGEIDR